MVSSIRHFLIFLILGVAILTLAYCGNDHPPVVVADSATQDKFLNHGDSAHYVGINTCKLCHQDIYNTFIQTGMGKSFDHASRMKSSARFEKHTVIYDKYSDFYYHPFWDNDSLMIMEFRLQGRDTIYKRVEKVDYIVGSGQHTNSHIQSVNGYLNQMPMTFYTQSGRWDLPPGFENGFNTRFSRKIGLECMSCHNSLPDFVQGSENKFNSLPEGISCERCHGPGSIHVAQRSTGSTVDTSRYIDYSIVNPGKLQIDRQFDVCQRCHLQGNTVLKNNKSFFDFRPGMKLSDYMTTFLPRYKDADNKFIMASHADRLKQSQCYIMTTGKIVASGQEQKQLRPYKNGLTCVTCHDPHVSVKVTGVQTFNNACIRCHNTSTHNELCAESLAIRNKTGDNCVSCHMPKSGSIDIPHVTVHDHFIRKPLKKEEIEKVKQFIGLYPINERNPDRKTIAAAYLQQYDKFDYNPVFLDSAAFYLRDKSDTDLRSDFELLVHLEFVRQDHKKILAYVDRIGREKILDELLINKSWDNSNAWTLYRIGESYYAAGNLEGALEFYQHADMLAPFNPEFKNKLASVLLALKRIPEGINELEAAVRENPKFVPALNNFGYASLLSGNEVAAKKYYDRALALDPDYIPLLMNIAGYKAYMKDYHGAKEMIKKILKKDPQNAEALEALAKLAAYK